MDTGKVDIRGDTTYKGQPLSDYLGATGPIGATGAKGDTGTASTVQGPTGAPWTASGTKEVVGQVIFQSI